jgi:sialic acid synthase SpsE
MLVAEIGLNHKGNKILLSKYVKFLLKSKIDAITFQIQSDQYVSSLGFKNIDLKYLKNQIRIIKKSKKKIGIAISDITKVKYFNQCKIDFWKILSKDFYSYNLINKLINTRKRIYLSTGFSSTSEIKKINSKYNFYFIHTALSNAIKDANLMAIKSISLETGNKVSFGLHCSNHNVLYASIPFNPESIFFYVKINSLTNYPDNRHAVLLKDVNKIVENINEIKKSIGSGKKIKILFKNNVTGKIK